MKKSLLLFLMASMVIATSNAQNVNFKNFTDKTVDVEINYPLCKNDKFSVEPGKTVSRYRGACTISWITATGAEPYTSPGTLFSEFGLIKFNDRLEVHHVDASGNPLDLPGGGYPQVTIVNKTKQTISGKIKYLSVLGLCKDDSYTVLPDQTFTPIANRGLCLLTEITGTSNDRKTVVAYKSSGTSYSRFGIVTNPITEALEAHRVNGDGKPIDIQPGFIIKNSTDFPVEVSLNQYSCLYHGVIFPGETMERETGGVWFTINYSINLDGTPKIDDFKDCALPVAQLVAELALAALSGSGGVVLAARAEAAGNLLAEQGAKVVSYAAIRYAASRSQNILLRQMLKAAIKKELKESLTKSVKFYINCDKGPKSINEINAIELGEELEKKYSGALIGQYAGSPLGITEKPTYEITGGPSIELENKDGPDPKLILDTRGARRLCITKINTVGDNMMKGSKSSTKCDPASATRTPLEVEYYHEVEVTNYTKDPQEVSVTYKSKDKAYQIRHEQDKFTVAAGAKGSPNNIREDFLIDEITITNGKKRYTPAVGAKPADYKFGIIDNGDESSNNHGTYEIYPLDDAGKPLNLSASTKVTYVEVGNYHNVVFYNNTNAQVTVTVNYTDGTKDQFTVASNNYGMAASIRGRRLITSVAATGAGVKDYSAVNCASFVGTNYRFGLGSKKQVSRSKPGGSLLNEPAPPNGVDLLLLSSTYDNDIDYPNKAGFKNSVPVGVKWFVDQSKDQTLLVSSNGKYSLVLNSRDGNNILLKNLTTTIWSTRTKVYDNYYFVRFQYDGNLVVWDSNPSEVWSANCGGQGGKTLKLEDDGRLVIYDAANKAIWSKGIDGKTTLTPATNTPTTGGATNTPSTTPAAAKNSAPAGSIWTYSKNNQTLLKSPNGIFTLLYQDDGNLVLYKNIKTPIWSSNTWGKTTVNFRFQDDGNLVIYGAGNSVVWSPNCYGKGGQTLTLQDDGNLVVYTAANKPIWATGTNGK